MKYFKSLSFLLMALLITASIIGCSGHSGVRQGDDTAWFSFTGNTRGAMASIDGGAPFLLLEKKYSQEKKVSPKHYAVPSGKHHISVNRDGIEVVNRTVLLGSQEVKEIYVP
ncbi:MAG: hypothetical protein R3Y11_08785 [Pseudomonadota bacterium]